MKLTLSKSVFAAAFTTILFSAIFLTAYAQTFSSAVELHGYAWSGGTDGTSEGGIGWISFNCDNNSSCASADYKVEINPDFTLDGFAWSSNVGWIQFGNGLSGCPSGSCDARVNATTGELEGWVRACAATQTGNCSGALHTEAGGWDGWISLNCDNDSCTYPYQVTVGQGTLSSYAWGSDIIGWVDFNPPYGGVTYDLPCTPSLQCSADYSEVIGTNQWCESSTYATCDLAAGESCNGVPPSCGVVDLGGYTLEASSDYVRYDSSVTLTWSIDDPSLVDSCHVTSNNGDDLDGVSGTDVTTNSITRTSVTYTLYCIPAGGGVETNMGSVEVNRLPTTFET